MMSPEEHMILRFNRLFIDNEFLLDAIDLCSKYSDGMLFHHSYKNCWGEVCYRLSPLNTDVSLNKDGSSVDNKGLSFGGYGK